MKKNKEINFAHRIMVHHFHDDKKHKKSQGSLSAFTFEKVIKKFKKKNLIDARIFCEKFLKKKLKKNHICFTFDDGIKSQFDIALPILNKHKIKAFFFIYSSVLETKPDNLEVYRYFRTNYFKNINDFYNIFFNEIGIDLEKLFKKNKKKINYMKKTFTYYSINDIKFRILRDEHLTKSDYHKLMKKLFLKKNFEPKKYFTKIFMNKKNIQKIIRDGHIIGLHSHSHPTNLEKFNKKQQEVEFRKNKSYLEKFSKHIYSMSHPCGSYNKTTLSILKQLNIKIGFKQHLHIDKDKGMTKINNSNLEIARRDSSEFLKMFKQPSLA